MQIFETRLFEQFEEIIIETNNNELSFEETIYYTSVQVYQLGYENFSDVDMEGFVPILAGEFVEPQYVVPTRITPETISRIHDLDRYTKASSIYINENKKLIYLQFPNSGIIYSVQVDGDLMETLAYFNSVSIIFIMLLFFLLITYTFTQLITDIVMPTKDISQNLAAIRKFDFESVKSLEYPHDIEELEDLIASSKALSKFLKNYVEEKNTLASAITHEIRSPLNTINSLIIGYQAGIEPYDDKEYFISQLQEKVEELSEISKHILYVYEVTEINKDFVSFNTQLHEILENHRPSLEIANLEVELIENDIFAAECSKQIVNLILGNLIKNISVYAKENSKVYIRVEKNSIYMINKKNSKSALGTQKGLKLTTHQLNQDGMKLYYNDVNDEYIVCISKESE
ncbi:HAMP domain-containing sensor histidine kinase [Mollicutes bacterium LVI A0039]|nr:HAMP domain-containing sensor histidine kinase [Mollicutes bacterium LVI A0039]